MFLTVQQVADRYSICRTSVWRWVKEGRLPRPVEIVEGVTRFSVADLEAHEERDREAAARGPARMRAKKGGAA